MAPEVDRGQEPAHINGGLRWLLKSGRSSAHKDLAGWLHA